MTSGLSRLSEYWVLKRGARRAVRDRSRRAATPASPGVEPGGLAGRWRPAGTVLAAMLALLMLPVADAQEIGSRPQFEVVTEQDVRIPLRDGSYLVADVFRPRSDETFPVLMSLSIYQKDLDPFLPHSEPYSHRETLEPGWWVPRGYVQIRVDSRGSGKSPGVTDVWSMQEARDFYDAIEWAGTQDWSSGDVGLAGVSYLAFIQWVVAGLQPPHLKTIIPWEGFTDLYRDAGYRGGIFRQDWWGWWYTHSQARQLLEPTRANNTGAIAEPIAWNLMRHPLDGPYWNEVKARAQFDKIAVPLYSAGNWGGHNLHLRGNIEGYARSASRIKKLQVHIGGHTEDYYSEEGKLEMLRWYDYWLKGIDTGIMDEPPVKLCVRTSTTACDWRFENEWPIARTEYTKFYLTEKSANVIEGSVNDGLLGLEPPSTEHVITYSAGPDSFARVNRDQPMVTFVTEPMTEDTEVTGYVNLVMWVSSTSEDMDIHARLHTMAPDGTTQVATNGVLKVSHRKLDPGLSTFYLPYHPHDEEQKLQPGEVVPVEVEIWPTSMVFKKGDRIYLDVAPYNYGQTHYDGTYNAFAENSIHVGGSRASYLLLPVVPPKQGATND